MIRDTPKLLERNFFPLEKGIISKEMMEGSQFTDLNLTHILHLCVFVVIGGGSVQRE
jgi:hypothetical protein